MPYVCQVLHVWNTHMWRCQEEAGKWRVWREIICCRSVECSAAAASQRYRQGRTQMAVMKTVSLFRGFVLNVTSSYTCWRISSWLVNKIQQNKMMSKLKSWGDEISPTCLIKAPPSSLSLCLVRSVVSLWEDRPLHLRHGPEPHESLVVLSVISHRAGTLNRLSVCLCAWREYLISPSLEKNTKRGESSSVLQKLIWIWFGGNWESSPTDILTSNSLCLLLSTSQILMKFLQDNY